MKDSLAINVSGAARQFEGLPFSGKVDAAKAFGVNSIEVHPYKEWPSFFHICGRELREIREKARGLDHVSVHAPMGETFTAPDEAKRKAALEGDRDSIRVAAFLGAKVVVVHVRMKYVKTEEDRRRAGEALRDLGDYADCFGVTLGVETSTDLRDPAHLAEIIRHADHPRVGVTLDSGHLLECLSEEDRKSGDVAGRYNALLHRAVDLFVAEKKTVHIHLNDIRAGKLWDHYGIGLGFVDFDGMMAKLIAGGYRGMWALEIHRGQPDEVSSLCDEEMRNAIAHTRALLARHQQAGVAGVTIRAAREEDVEPIGQIVREIWNIGFEYNFEQKFGQVGGVPWYDRTVPAIVSSVKGNLPGVLVAEIGGEVAGFMSYRAQEDRKLGTIGYNGVSPKHKKHGVGGALLRRALDILREKGMTHATVITGLNEGHLPARRMYERAGFEPIMESIAYAMKL